MPKLTREEAYAFAHYHREHIDPEGHPFSMSRVHLDKYLPGRGSSAVWTAYTRSGGGGPDPWFRTFYFDPERGEIWAVRALTTEVHEYRHPDLQERLDETERLRRERAS